MLEAAEQWHQTEVLRGQVFELTGQIVDLTRQLEESQRRAKAAAARTAALEASAHENAAMVQAAAEAALISEVDGGSGSSHSIKRCRGHRGQWHNRHNARARHDTPPATTLATFLLSKG